MKTHNRTAILCAAALLLGALSGCSNPTSNISDSPTGTEHTIAVGTRAPAVLDLTGATVISLNGSAASVDGSGAAVNGSVVTISKAGVYAVSGTLDDGRIIVDADGAQVTVALNGADITCSYGSPLYIYDAKSTTIHLMEGTDNTLTDGEVYTFADTYSSEADEEPNACLYSKDDLVLQGAGSLTVNGNYHNGLTSKDTLEIYDCALTVNAKNHGVNGKDSNTVDSATLIVTSGGDALRSTNDTDDTLGWVSVSNATLVLTSGEDGVQAETWASFAAVDVTVTSGGGSSVDPSEDTSAKGIKAGADLTLESGSYVMDCSDDAFHTNGDLTVKGGMYTISSGDDAFHADETLTVVDGDIEVTACYEGLEGSNVNVEGGSISITADDDGVNAAGGADGSGFMGRGGMNGAFSGGGASDAIHISGGSLTMLTGGDGIDSNGSLTISGGQVVVCSTGRDDGALDGDGGIDITGGVVFAATGGSMPGAPSDPGQNTLSVGFGETLAAGTYVQFSGDGWSYVFQLSGAASSAVFSAPELTEGSVCTVSYGGSYDGSTYSGGAELAQITVTGGLNTYGQAGGMGGMPGGGRGDQGGKGQFGAGTAPDMPTDGNFAPGQRQDGEMPSDTPPENEMAQGGQTPPGGGRGGMGDRRAPEDGSAPPDAGLPGEIGAGDGGTRAS